MQYLIWSISFHVYHVSFSYVFLHLGSVDWCNDEFNEIVLVTEYWPVTFAGKVNQ